MVTNKVVEEHKLTGEDNMAHRRKGRVPKRIPFENYFPSMRCNPSPKPDPLDSFLESTYGSGRSNRKPDSDIPKKDYGVLSKESNKWVFNPKVFIPGTVFESIFWPSKYQEIEQKKTSSGCNSPSSGPAEPDDDEISQIIDDYFPMENDSGDDDIEDCENLDSRQQVSCNGNESEEDLNVTDIIGENVMHPSSLCNGQIITGYSETPEIQEGVLKRRFAEEISNGAAFENCNEHSSETNKKVKIEEIRLELSSSDDDCDDVQIVKILPRSQSGDKEVVEIKRIERSLAAESNGTKHSTFSAVEPKIAATNNSNKCNSGNAQILIEQKENQNNNSIPGNKKQFKGFQNGSSSPLDGLDKVLQSDFEQLLNMVGRVGGGQICKITDEEPMNNIDVECVCVSPIRNKKYSMVEK